MPSSPDIVVIDYESGNLRSVAKALEALGISPAVTGDPDRLAAADGVILPGVGSAAQAMAALQGRGLIGPINDYVRSGKPFFGVCLGLQLLLERTEEGGGDCLGLVAGQVKLFSAGAQGEPFVHPALLPTDNPFVPGDVTQGYAVFGSPAIPTPPVGQEPSVGDHGPVALERDLFVVLQLYTAWLHVPSPRCTRT